MNRASVARLRRLRQKELGFTIPELISVMIVTVMFSSLIMFFTFQYWSASATLSNDLQTFVGRLNAGDRLREAINASSGLINQNSISDPNAGDPDTSIVTGDFWKIIHAVPGTITAGAAGTKTSVLYFRAPSVDASKNVIMNGSQPYEDEYILYLDGTTKQLRMRVLANSSAAGNHAVTTCPAALVTTACPIDRLIGEDVASISLRYFSKSGNTMDYTSIVDPITGDYIGPDLPAVEVLEMTLAVYRKSTLHGGANTTSQTIVRIALRNA